MNYRHVYHAGNFCDIIKHLTLIAILRNLLKKEKPFAVLDCFAGIGLYNINSAEASKTNESESGIKKLLSALSSIDQVPELLNEFIRIIKSTGDKSFYPGSPLIIKNLIRPMDQLIACELQKDDYKVLQRIISTGVHNLDAYVSLKAFLPFKEKRGLVFLDPAFEVKNEFEKLVNALRLIKQRAAGICTLIWYPIKDQKQISPFYADCKQLGFKEILKIEFSLKNLIPANIHNSKKKIQLNSLRREQEEFEGESVECRLLQEHSRNSQQSLVTASRNDAVKYYMNSCGLLLVNPPYINQELEQNIDYITKYLYNGEAEYLIELL